MLLFLFLHHNSHFIVNIDDIIMHYFLELSHVLFIVLFYFPLFWWSFIIECSLGNYGYNCNQACDGCLSDSCDNEHGVCTDKSRCKPGRQHVDPWKCDIGMSTIYYVFICMHSKGTFRQIVEIPMRTTGAPLIGDLFLYWLWMLIYD